MVPVLPDRPLLISMKWTGDPAAAPSTFDARTDAGATVTLPVRALAIRRRRPNLESPLRYTQWKWAEPAFEFVEWNAGESSEDVLAAHLLAVDDPSRWPGTGLHAGAVRIGLVAMEPDPREPPCGPLPSRIGFDEPPATSPMDAVRRALWRRHVNPQAPVAASDERSIAALLSRQAVGRWCAALRDLALIDPGLSVEVERLLVRTMWDGSTRFAAWPAAPHRLAELETILFARALDGLRDEDWRMRLKSWVSRQPGSIAWIEHDAASGLRMACGNLTAHRQHASMNLAGRAGEVSRVELAPLSVSRVMIERPIESPSQVLVVEIGPDNTTLPLLETEVVILPPGRTFAIPWQNWTLETWQNGEPAVVDGRSGTTLRIQRSPEQGHWELIVTCALSEPLAPARADGPDPLRDLAHWRELVGYESFTLLLGPHDHPVIAATIRPDGSVRDWARSSLLRTEAVRVTRGEDRWQATIALPEALVADAFLEIGALRMHEGDDVVDCFPRPALPWRTDPGRLHLDLSRWEALPRPPEKPAASTPTAGRMSLARKASYHAMQAVAASSR